MDYNDVAASYLVETTFRSMHLPRVHGYQRGHAQKATSVVQNSLDLI
jgi:hypothetical protein